MSEAAQQQQQEQQQQEQQQPQKPSKKRNLRQKRALEEDHEADEVPEVQTELLQDLKLLQKQRKRVPGVDANKLVPAATAEDDAADNELMDAQYVKAEVNVKSQILDEDAHMQRYVEQQLAARLGKSVDDLEQKLSKQEQEELELYRLPEGLQVRKNYCLMPCSPKLRVGRGAAVQWCCYCVWRHSCSEDKNLDCACSCLLPVSR